MKILVAAVLMACIIFGGMFAVAVGVQLWPGERPGICGRDCY